MIATQRRRILAHLEQGKPITPLEALKEYGSLRLGARIYDLRRDGYDIRTRMIEVAPNKQVAEYKLIGRQNNAV